MEKIIVLGSVVEVVVVVYEVVSDVYWGLYEVCMVC